ncbi:LysR family transcriptional regulator [Vibrio tritonius]|uniref:LysR family transcriptional regulator n=1 Tax=Vibrio tritonius TaxID=1435069 RepID=UPI00315C54A6
MELRHLRYFLAVAETQNIRAASNIVHVTQPAISRQIQELEQELGVELFERLPRGLRLNSAGQQYQKHVQEVLKKLDEANQQLQDFVGAVNGSLRLGGVEVVLWEGNVPKLIKQFRHDHAQVNLDIRTDNSPKLIALLDNETIDGAFVYAFGQLPDHLEHQQIGVNYLKLAYPVEWAVKDKPLSLADLQSSPMIRFPRSIYPAYYDWQQELFNQLNITTEVSQWAHNESAMLGLVATGSGFAVVNERQIFRGSPLIHFMDITVNSESTKKRNTNENKAELPLLFVHKKGNDNPALKAFVQLIAETI